jgi:hypothetical protein
MAIQPIRMFEQRVPDQSRESNERSQVVPATYSQDQMLDEVFGSGINSRAISTLRKPVNAEPFTTFQDDGQGLAETSVLIRLIKNQNKVQ